MGCSAGLALETVGVKQREEEVEVLFDPGVRRRRHQEQVAGDRPGEAAEFVTLRLLDLATGVVGGQLVSLVHHDEIPVGRLKFGSELFVSAEVVEAGDEQRLLREWVAAARGLDHLPGQDLEAEAELLPQLVLPLLNEAARSPIRGELRARL